MFRFVKEEACPNMIYIPSWSGVKEAFSRLRRKAANKDERRRSRWLPPKFVQVAFSHTM